MIHFESGVEKDFIYLLEFDKRVTSFEEQPIRIDYKLKARKHTYTPDFQAVVEGETWLYECKPEKFVNKPINLLKFDVAKKWCDSQGWGFQVVTAEFIRAGYRLKNVKYLMNFSRFEISHTLIAKIYEFFANKSFVRYCDVAAGIPEHTVNEIYPALFHLTFHHKFSFPMIDTEKISPLSEILLER
jgi:hypothetical protein